jgi:tetratricopeptide (TPR) repeat protein
MRNAGKLEEAAEEFHALAESAQSEGDRGVYRLNEAYCLGELHRMEDAWCALREAKELSPGDEEYDLRVGLAEACLCKWQGEPGKAIERLDRLLQAHAGLLRAPGLRDLYEITRTMRGSALVDLQRYAEARPVLEEALGFEGPKEPEFYCHLGICYYGLREYERAKQALAQALQGRMSAGWTVAAHYFLGLAHRALGAAAWAKRELETAAQLGRGHGNEAQIYRELAETCRRLGLHEEARRYESLAKTL